MSRACFLFLAFWPAVALAQPPASPSPAPQPSGPPSPAASRPSPTASPSPSPSPSPPADPGQTRRTGSTFAITAGSPLGVSGSAGLVIGRVHTGGGSCPSAVGTLLQAEAGVGGGKVSLGRLFFTYCYTPFGSLGAAGVKLSLLRTWGSPLWAPKDRTYLGPEIDIGIMDWKLSLGLLVRLGSDEGGRVRFTFGLGRGF